MSCLTPPRWFIAKRSFRSPSVTACQQFTRLRVFVIDGGLISYGIDYPEMFRKAASYVDRILRGAKPNELPVQLPTKFELVINLKTAKSIGLTFPQTIIASADDVIE